MASPRSLRDLRLVNGSIGDPALFIDDDGRDNALLFDAGENAALSDACLGDLEAVFLTHHHVDHFIGFDRIVRANLDRDKALHVFGPTGTINKIYNRIKSYEYPFFPFQKIVLELHEIEPGKLHSAPLLCAERFPKPKVVETNWEGPLIYQSAGLKVEATFVDHTVPCLAYAAVEEPRLALDPSRLAEAGISAGRWVNQAIQLIQASAPAEAPVAVPGSDRDFTLGELKSRFFVESPGSRVAYVTDTAWSPAVRPQLLKLALGARRLYCDSFYAAAQAAQAEKYRHMTATQAAEFAREAEVEELVLIHFASRYKGQYEALLEEARAIFPNTSAEIPAPTDKKRKRGSNTP